MSELIRLENIHKMYQMGPDMVPVLRGVDLSVSEGEFVAIMGASGSGKSTLLHIAGALDHPDMYANLGKLRPPGNTGDGEPEDVLQYSNRKSVAGTALPPVGEVFFRDEALSKMGRHGRHRLRNTQFGFVFQFYHLLPELNVLENVLLPAYVEPTPRWLVYGVFLTSGCLIVLGLIALIVGAFVWALLAILGVLAMGAGIAALLVAGAIAMAVNLYKLFFWSNPKKEEARQLLDSFGLTARLKHRPSQLSGGERQRVAIARALINSPALLLADEPTGNLDAKTGRAILDVLLKLHKEKGQTILLVTHDPMVAGMADRIVRLEEGRIKG